MKFITLALTFCLITACKTDTSSQKSKQNNPEKEFKSQQIRQTDSFDYYVMAMSWSPEYCNGNGRRDGEQCGSGRRLGFVLHGLWPQFERGYPQNCSNERLPTNLKRRFEGLFPSEKLFNHEWEKHGTCSDLSAEDYLQLSKTLKQNLRIPRIYQSPPNDIRSSAREMKMAFTASNNNFTENGFAPMCRGRYFRELLVCFDSSGNPRDCSADVLRKSNRSCKNRQFTMRNVR